MLQKDLESEAGVKSICDALWNRDQDEDGNKSDESWQWYNFKPQKKTLTRGARLEMKRETERTLTQDPSQALEDMLRMVT